MTSTLSLESDHVEPGRKVSGYAPVRQLGVGPDGAAMLARDPSSGGFIELRYLSRARVGSERWAAIQQALRLHAMIDHPVVRAVHDVAEVGPAGDVPVVMLAWPGDERLIDRLREGPLMSRHALQLAERLAHALSIAHRMGLHHGALGPSSVFVEAGMPRIELTGIRVTSPWALTAVDRACAAPEQDREPLDASTDVYALGALVACMLRGYDAVAEAGLDPAAFGAEPLWRLLAAMMAPDRDRRPSAAEACLELRELLPAHVTPSVRPATEASVAVVAAADVDDASATPLEVAPGVTLGRFRLIRKLGEGGMGVVYLGMDLSDGREVAVKVLRRVYADNPDLLRRFRKEARMLSEIRSPYVANLLEVNSDRGVHYLALEYAGGRTLADEQHRTPRFAERDALSIMADVCRALAEAHRRGIVHRDIKPENVMLLDDEASGRTRVKVCDFGIARHADQRETVRMTREGMTIGTPMFMAPEQCAAKGIEGPAADVYAIGVTLFLLIAGRPPFDDADAMRLLVRHINEKPPMLTDVATDASAATEALVARALAKDPADRFADAGEMLDAIDKILRGAPVDIDAHPHVPVVDARTVSTRVFEWDLAATPEQLWPYVSNTDRMNRATGVPAVRFELRAAAGAVEAFGAHRVSGLELRWREFPFEWIEGRRWGVLRVFETGALRWYIVEVELRRRPEGGTRLKYTVRLEPRNWLGRIAAAVEIGWKQRRALDRTFHRIDALLARTTGAGPEHDPFVPAPPMRRAAAQKLDRVLAQLRDEGLDPAALEHLGGLIRGGSDQEIARIRPLALARRYKLDPERVVAACLHAARRGLLTLMWDVLCPLCRIPSSFVDSLKNIQDHSHCAACNADFQLDFARSIELIFRVAPEIRHTELRTYCIGGPAHFPHVVAQVRLAPGERFLLGLGLTPGEYKLRSPQLPNTVALHASSIGQQRRLDLAFGENSPGPDERAHLAAGDTTLALTNGLERELVVRIERAALRDDALTAARASAMPTFRELFPDEVLGPGQLISVTNTVLLMTDLADAAALFGALGDARAFETLLLHFQLLSETVDEEGGALLKTVGNGVVAVFDRPVAAARAALRLHARLKQEPRTADLHLRIAVHQGPTMAATVNDRLDYFGQTVAVAEALLASARGGQIVVGRAVADEPEVAAVLAQWKLRAETLPVADAPGGQWALRIAAPLEVPEEQQVPGDTARATSVRPRTARGAAVPSASGMGA